MRWPAGGGGGARGRAAGLVGGRIAGADRQPLDAVPQLERRSTTSIAIEHPRDFVARRAVSIFTRLRIGPCGTPTKIAPTALSSIRIGS